MSFQRFSESSFDSPSRFVTIIRNELAFSEAGGGVAALSIDAVESGWKSTSLSSCLGVLCCQVILKMVDRNFR